MNQMLESLDKDLKIANIKIIQEEVTSSFEIMIKIEKLSKWIEIGRKNHMEIKNLKIKSLQQNTDWMATIT